MLYIGEKVGIAAKHNNGRKYPEVDIAVDPLEGTNLCATGAPNALATRRHWTIRFQSISRPRSATATSFRKCV